MNNNPIGLFDSGVGGTSILKEIHALMPHEDCIYLADSKNAPYGAKPQKEILRLSIKNTELLIKNNCKIIVVACNTATTNTISYLRAHYPLPFIGIEPAIKPAALQTKTNTIGILATKGTLSSALFHNTSLLYASGITVIEQVGEGLVPLIEAGKSNSEEMLELLKQYINPMLDQNIDYLVLGCTHYPYLIPQILTILPKDVKIIDSGMAVAQQTRSVLTHHKLINPGYKKGRVKAYSNRNVEVLRSILNNKFEVTSLDF